MYMIEQILGNPAQVAAVMMTATTSTETEPVVQTLARQLQATCSKAQGAESVTLARLRSNLATKQDKAAKLDYLLTELALALSKSNKQGLTRQEVTTAERSIQAIMYLLSSDNSLALAIKPLEASQLLTGQNSARLTWRQPKTYYTPPVTPVA
jgi:hypothetical protein